MPRGRKRKDPADAPIDGDYSQDQVRNKQAGWTYKLLHRDDIPRLKGMGYVPEERGREDSAVPVYDMGSASDSGYEVGNLTLWKAPNDVAARIDAGPQKTADIRMKTIRSEAKQRNYQVEKFSAEVQK